MSMPARFDCLFPQCVCQLLLIGTFAAGCSAQQGQIGEQELASKREMQVFLEREKWIPPGVNAAVCPELLAALTAGSADIRVVEPTIHAAEYSPEVFDRYQSRCPALPLNEFGELAYGSPYVGAKNAKTFELPRPSGGLWFLFYAEGFYNQGVGARSPPRGGYASGPGNSAQYMVYDLEACELRDVQDVHEPTFHATGETLPNRNAVVEYRGEFWIIDLFADFDNRAKRHVTAMLMSERTPTPVINQCRFNND